MSARQSMPQGVVCRYEPRPCPDCGGEGGSTQTHSDGTTFRQFWVSCRSCKGSGAR